MPSKEPRPGAANASEMVSLLEAAVLEIEPGAEAMAQTIADIEGVKERNIETASLVMNLCLRVKDIAWKFRGVDEIVRRLRVLVLNTKVFSAQAGQHGRGFMAIVAEIEEHGERLRDSARDVKDVLEAIHQDSKNTNANIEREALRVDPVTADANQAALALRNLGEHCAAAQKIAQAMAMVPAEIGPSKAGELAQLVDAAISEAERGSEAVTRTISGIYRLEERNHLPSRTIFAADYRLGSMRERLEAIHAMARRWGNLATHARNLATQAGKYGPGFQVIAEEMEMLGRRLTLTAKDTQDRLDLLDPELKSEFVAELYRSGASSVDLTVEKANFVERTMSKMRNICVDARKNL
jgi:methyl-accepting chemotaxis protein